MQNNNNRKNLSILNLLFSSFVFKLNLYIIGCIIVKYNFEEFRLKNLKIKINNIKYNIYYPLGSFTYKCLLPITIKFYIVKIPIKDLLNSRINNRIIFNYTSKGINIDKKYEILYI